MKIWNLPTKIKALSKQPGFVILQTALNNIPFRPIRIGWFSWLCYEGVPDLDDSILRGPGEIRKGTPDDIEGLVECRDVRDEFVTRFEAGDSCVVGVVNGRIVGYEWFSMNSDEIRRPWGYEIKMPPDSIFAYDAFILPEYRVIGLWLKFKLFLAGLMRESGKSKIVTAIDYGNWLSFRTHLRFGFRQIKSVLAVHALGRRWFFERPIGVPQ